MKEWAERPSFGSAIADLAGRVGTQERVVEPPPLRFRFEVVGSCNLASSTLLVGTIRSTPWSPPTDVVFDELVVLLGSADTVSSTWSLKRSGATVQSATVNSGWDFGFVSFASPVVFTPMHRLTFSTSQDGTHAWADATVIARGWSPVPFIGSGGLGFRWTSGE